MSSVEATAQEISGLLPYLTKEELAELDRLVASGPMWAPLPGPQTDALLSSADELFYGGAAGGGKTDLIIGLGLTQHYNSIIFRREYPQLKGIIARSREIVGSRGRYNGQEAMWRLDDGRTLEFGAVQYDEDVRKYQGRPHDLIAFDELPNFLHSQYIFLGGWLRTTRPGQRTRKVSTGNPPDPTKAEQLWVIERWAAWLDGQHPNPALPGELRWYAMVDGQEVEREDGSHFSWKGELIVPQSRTFIPARLSDNPHLMSTGYMATLQALPEPLRSQLLHGDFAIGVEDHPWQVIPTVWVREAMARWRPEGKPLAPMSAVGVDVAHGGKDYTVLAKRWGSWFDELERYPGVDTATGQIVAGKVAMALVQGGYANIDGIGVGTSAYDQLSQMPIGSRVHSIIFSEAAKDWQGNPLRDKTGTLEFANMRAYAWWMMREALDPDSGQAIALPPDNRLLADLVTPRWEMRMNRVLVESKQEIAKRLDGRSTDDGDAAVLSALPVQVPPAPAIPTYVSVAPQRPGNPFGRR